MFEGVVDAYKRLRDPVGFALARSRELDGENIENILARIRNRDGDIKELLNECYNLEYAYKSKWGEPYHPKVDAHELRDEYKQMMR